MLILIVLNIEFFFCSLSSFLVCFCPMYVPLLFLARNDIIFLHCIFVSLSKLKIQKRESTRGTAYHVDVVHICLYEVRKILLIWW